MGLVAAYSDGVREVTVIVDTPHFALIDGESIHPQIATSFSVQWRGFIEILLSGRYRFSVEGNASSCRINGKAVLERWIDLDAGLHALELAYARGPGAARVQWVWESEYFGLEPLPASRLYHDAADPRLGFQSSVEAGRQLVLSLGCANCHAGAAASGRPRSGPDLSTIGARSTSSWLNVWLTDPSRFRPHPTMPVILSEAERVDVVAYLSSLDGASFPALESRGGPHDIAKGRQHYWALGCAACHEQESLMLGALGSKTTTAALTEFLLNPSAVSAGGAMPDMMLTRIEAEQLAWFLLQRRDPAFEVPAVRGDAQHGRALLMQRGCLACHALDDAGPLKNTLNAPAMADLQAGRGCPATEVPIGLPRYTLTARQRQDLGAFVASQHSS
ncbi:MAG: c-type cytochrome, partial [Planctomycetes bacterium]|nr:c-type cytochrome [Planctomycetota bacterium]